MYGGIRTEFGGSNVTGLVVITVSRRDFFSNFDFKFSSERRTGAASDKDVTFPVGDYRGDAKNGERYLAVCTHKTPNVVIIEHVPALVWRTCVPLV